MICWTFPQNRRMRGKKKRKRKKKPPPPLPYGYCPRANSDSEQRVTDDSLKQNVLNGKAVSVLCSFHLEIEIRFESCVQLQWLTTWGSLKTGRRGLCSVPTAENDVGTVHPQLNFKVGDRSAVADHEILIRNWTSNLRPVVAAEHGKSF